MLIMEVDNCKRVILGEIKRRQIIRPHLIVITEISHAKDVFASLVN